jgi:PAS domain S-box-containing protein
MTDDSEKWGEMRDRIIGLGDQSSRKSYYPELQKKIEQLEEAREKIRISEENLKAVINGIHDAIIIHDYNGTILDVNESFYSLYGIAAGSAGKYTIKDITSPDINFDDAEKLWGNVREGHGELFEWKALRPSTGQVFEVEVAVRPLQWYGKDVIIAEVRDISDRKRLEQMLRQSQKMDAIGQLAGGFAHDFNNLLGGIIGFAELITLSSGGNASVSQYANVIMNTATQAADMARRLLDFSRKNVAAKNPVMINVILRKTISLLERTIDRRITIRYENDGKDRFVFGDASQLQNAFLNVCINARDAMINGGEIYLKVDDLVLNRSQVHGAFQLERGDYVRIEISDTGCGMPAEILERIFEPFFTTKETGKGTGLGLTAVYGCVRDHGGAVSVETSEGKGTTFIFVFPVYREIVEEQSSAGSDVSFVGHGERILVVDDEEIIRDMVKDMLSRLGYKVDTAVDGVDALERFTAGTYDLVLLDAIMPRMNGAETFSALKKADPAVKVVFCSGYSEGVLTGEHEKIGEGYIQKPYGISALSETIWKALSL